MEASAIITDVTSSRSFVYRFTRTSERILAVSSPTSMGLEMSLVCASFDASDALLAGAGIGNHNHRNQVDHGRHRAARRIQCRPNVCQGLPRQDWISMCSQLMSPVNSTSLERSCLRILERGCSGVQSRTACFSANLYHRDTHYREAACVRSGAFGLQILTSVAEVDEVPGRDSSRPLEV
jgi:hypothetical protein